MLLITLIGLSDDMGGKDFVLLDLCLKKAIADAVGGKEKINEKEIAKFIPKPIVSPSYKGNKVFIFISGFYSHWMASGLWPDKDTGGLVTRALESSVKSYLKKFNDDVRVQCSIVTESGTVTG